MSTLTYNVNPEELRALVDGIKEFFRQAAKEQCVDISDAVSLLTDVVRLVEPGYTPPEPDEVEWDTVDMDYAEPPLPEDENKEVKELIQLFGVEKAHVLVIPLTDEEMNAWVEFHLAKDLAEYEAAKARTLEVEG
jgi:hypothetical protein